MSRRCYRSNSCSLSLPMTMLLFCNGSRSRRYSFFIPKPRNLSSEGSHQIQCQHVLGGTLIQENPSLMKRLTAFTVAVGKGDRHLPLPFSCAPLLGPFVTRLFRIEIFRFFLGHLYHGAQGQDHEVSLLQLLVPLPQGFQVLPLLSCSWVVKLQALAPSYADRPQPNDEPF